MWATGLLLHRRARRHFRIGWGIVAGTAIVCGVFLGLLTVVATEVGTIEVFGLILSGWLYYLARFVLVVYWVSILPVLWMIGIDLINFHRLYHLPMDYYKVVTEERQEKAS